MRFFHLSDLHIGKQFHFYSLLEDQEYILNEILDKIEQFRPDAVLISGDIYDKAVPSAEAVTVFDAFLTGISGRSPETEVLIISGNHDSPGRLSFASRILERNKIHIVCSVPKEEGEFLSRVVLEDEYGEVCFYLLPFFKPGNIRKLWKEEETPDCDSAAAFLLQRENPDPGKRNVLLSHQFYTGGTKEPKQSDSESFFLGGVGNIDVSRLEPFDYAALGHLHRPQWIGRESVRYCGSPLKYSVSEENDSKSITCVTLEEKGKKPLIEEIPLVPLREVRQKKGTSRELLESGVCEDYISLILTDTKMPYQIREKLGNVYRRILEIKVENTRVLEAMQLSKPEKRETPLEAFEKFYREIHGVSMEEEERALMMEILKEAEEEGE